MIYVVEIDLYKTPCEKLITNTLYKIHNTDNIYLCLGPSKHNHIFILISIDNVKYINNNNIDKYLARQLKIYNFENEINYTLFEYSLIYRELIDEYIIDLTITNLFKTMTIERLFVKEITFHQNPMFVDYVE